MDSQKQVLKKHPIQTETDRFNDNHTVILNFYPIQITYKLIATSSSKIKTWAALFSSTGYRHQGQILKVTISYFTQEYNRTNIYLHLGNKTTGQAI